MHAPSLESNRLHLTELSLTFLEDMFEYSKLSAFYKHMELEPHRSLNETRNYLLKLLNRVEGGNSLYWAICLSETHKMIGTIGVVDIDVDGKMAQIGYGLSPYYWQSGFFKECLQLVVPYCYDSLGLHILRARTMSENIPSIRGLLSYGFCVEKHLPQYYQIGDGTHRDAAVLFLNLRNRFGNPTELQALAP